MRQISKHHIKSCSLIIWLQTRNMFTVMMYCTFCVSVILDIQHTTHTRRIILSSVACPALPYFSTVSHKRHDFRKRVTEKETCVLIFSTTFIWNISQSKEDSARYHKFILVFIQSTQYSCQILKKFEFSRQIFEKRLNIKFNENPSSGNRVVQRKRTDTQVDANNHFWLFCERAYGSSKNVIRKALLIKIHRPK
jgi:hypothetical protein